jgi:hypothetical protein
MGRCAEAGEACSIITDVDVVRVEGVGMSGIGPEKALALATTQSKQIAAHLA